MANKLKLFVLFGGNSPEHEGSLFSAFNTLKIIDAQKYDLVPIAITKNGEFWTGPADKLIEKADKFKLRDFTDGPDFIQLKLILGNFRAYFTNKNGTKYVPDIIFPLIHGQGGEDGAIFGLCYYGQVPCIGSGILGSAITMDKAITKSLLISNGIKVAKFRLINTRDLDESSYQKLVDELALPFFVKPVDLGSSVGIHKINSQEDFNSALEDIAKYSSLILAEEFIDGREIECAVLGNDKLQVTVPGEVITNQEYYDHDTKMYAAQNVRLEIPAKLDDQAQKLIVQTATEAYRICRCQDMARVDFFLTANNELYLNEINSIPGFADMSLYPRLWEYEGKTRSQLIDDLVNIALARSSSER